MNRFDVGQQAMMSRLKATAGRTVTYTYGTITNGVYTETGSVVFGITNGVNQQMWVGQSKYALQPKNPGGATIAWGDRDYFCSVIDFEALVGAGITPVKGDRITDVDPDGTTVVFELQTPTNEPVSRRSDQTRWEYRLHCKRVG